MVIIITMLPEVCHCVLLVIMLVKVALYSINRIGNIVGIACQTFWRSFQRTFWGFFGFALPHRVQYLAAPGVLSSMRSRYDTDCKWLFQTVTYSELPLSSNSIKVTMHRSSIEIN